MYYYFMKDKSDKDSDKDKKIKRTVDLFGEVDIELKEKIIAANNAANEIRKSKRRKVQKAQQEEERNLQKTQEKKNEKYFYEIFKDNFYSALKETKKYLSWGRHTSGLNKSKYVELYQIILKYDKDVVMLNLTFGDFAYVSVIILDFD